MKTRAELKAAAKKQLAGKWMDAAIFTLVYMVIVGLASGLSNALGNSFSWVGTVITLLIAGPLCYALSKYFLRLMRGEKVEWKIVFEGFTGDMLTPSIKLYLWMMLKIVLWSLLFIIPGIIKGYAYSQAFFLLTDDKKLGFKEALDKSEAMMDGHKWELFVLQLSFIGWAILASLTCGIGYLWLAPYITTTLANYYEELKTEKKEIKVAA